MTRQAAFAVLLLFTVASRFYGLSYGLPRVSHPDEERVLLMTVGVLERAELEGSDYGVVVPRVNAAVVSSAARLGVPVLRDGVYDWPLVITICRGVAAGFGVLAVLLAFLCGNLLGGFAAGIVAGLLVAVSPLHVQLSHMMSVDAHAAAFCGLALYGALVYRKAPCRSRAMLCGGAVAVAVGAKLSAVAAVPLGLALVMTVPGTWARRLGHGAICGATMLAVLVALHVEHIVSLETWLTPNWYDPLWWHGTNFPNGMHKFLWNVLMTQGALTPLWPRPSTGAQQIGLVLVFGLGVPLIAALGVAIWRTIRGVDREVLAVGAAAVLLALPFLTAEVKFARYVLIAIVPLCVFAATGALAAFQGASRRARKGLAAAAAIFAAQGLYVGIVATALYGQQDTRVAAAAWIHTHVPRGAIIGMSEDYYFSVDVDEERHAARTLDWYNLYDKTVEQVNERRWPWWLGAIPPRVSFISDEARAGLAGRIATFHAELTHFVVHERTLGMIFATTDPAFEPARAFYRDLLAGKLGMTLVKTFAADLAIPFPGMSDRGAEHTTRIYDHGAVFLYARPGVLHVADLPVDLTPAQLLQTDFRLSRIAAMKLKASKPERARVLFERAYGLVVHRDPALPWLVNLDGCDSFAHMKAVIETDLGWFEIDAHRPQRAAELLSGAIEVPKQRPWAALGLATALLDLGMHRGAATAIELAAESKMDHALLSRRHVVDVQATHARIREARGDRLGAIATLERVLASRDALTAPWPRAALASWLLDEGRPRDAVVVLGSAPLRHRSVHEPRLMAEAYLDLGDLESARTVAEDIGSARDRHEVLARIEALMGLTYGTSSGRSEVRCSSPRESLRRRCAFELVLQAERWDRMGDAARAERDFQEAVALDRADPVVLLAYVRAAARRGDCVHAAAVMSDARRLGAAAASSTEPRCHGRGAG